MNYIDRGCNSITLMTTETKLGEDRFINIKGPIDSEVADAFTEQMLILRSVQEEIAYEE